MTIGTAWILMFSSIIVLFAFGVVIGIINGFFKTKNPNVNLFDAIMLGMLASFIICGIIGFYQNKKELFFTHAVSKPILLVSLLMGFLWSYISSILFDYYSINPEASKMSLGLSGTWWFAILLNVALVVFQIGVIGHGLLRNYPFNKALITVCFISVSFFVPAAVVAMIFQSLILFFLYHRTASFWLVLVVSNLMYLPSYFGRYIFGGNEVTRNFYKLDILPNAQMYYLVWVICLIALVFSAFWINKKAKVIDWQRASEYESFD
jgi:hypothetical protein